MTGFIVLTTVIGGVWLSRYVWGKNKWITPIDSSFPPNWRSILVSKVPFYNSLTNEAKKLFEFKINEFVLNHKIVGVNTDVDIADKLLVASSAIIPIFAFPNWRYNNLDEVLLYPNAFNEKFEIEEGDDRYILGMVGTGYMEGKMILSKQALHLGFSNESDKNNTAIHEFVHLIDKSDGIIDGIPEVLLEKQYIIPWLDLIAIKIEEINKNSSDINPYGATNKAEFFAVISEYFFERPQLLAKKHPHLYNLLENIFDQKMHLMDLKKSKNNMGRNAPCPCNSGLKFKKCCGIKVS